MKRCTTSFFATHTGDPSASPATGTASPSSATVTVADAATIPDVTPPSFAAQTPFVATADDSSGSRRRCRVRGGDGARVDAPGGRAAYCPTAPPPSWTASCPRVWPCRRDSTARYSRPCARSPRRGRRTTRRSTEQAAAATRRFSGSRQPPCARHGVRGVRGARGRSLAPNVGGAVAAMATRTAACSPCDASQNLYLPAFSCACVEGLTVVLRLSTSGLTSRRTPTTGSRTWRGPSACSSRRRAFSRTAPGKRAGGDRAGVTSQPGRHGDGE